MTMVILKWLRLLEDVERAEVPVSSVRADRRAERREGAVRRLETRHRPPVISR